METEKEPLLLGRAARQVGPWVFGLLVIVALFLLLEKLDLNRVVEMLGASEPGPVVLAALVNLTLNTWARVGRRRVLLAAGSPGTPAIGFLDLSRLLLASFAVNNLLPARAGDVLFAVQMRSRGYRMAAVVSAQAAEKLVELASLWMLIPPALVLAHPPEPIASGLYFSLGAGGLLGALAVAMVFAGPGPRSVDSPGQARETAPRPISRGRIRSAFRASVESLRQTASAGVLLRALAWSSAQDASDLLMVALVAQAVDIHVGLGGWVLVYLAVNLASSLPSTPGQIGLLEAGALVALVALGVGPNRAMAFAFLYHAAHLVPVTLAGLPALWRGRRPDEPPATFAPSP